VVREQSGGPTPTPIATATPSQTPTNAPTNTPTRTPTPTTAPTTPSAGNTGFLGPSTNAAQTSSSGDNNGYEVNPTNAQADGGGVAQDVNSGTNSNSSCTNAGKDKHRFYNYNFSLPVGVTVTGMEVRLDAFADSTSSTPRLCVQLSWDGGITWTAAKQTTRLTTSEAAYILGGASDNWGHVWTLTNLSSTNFRVRVIEVASSSGATSRDFSLDWIAVRVSYQQ
jgi:hypothetical protein